MVEKICHLLRMIKKFIKSITHYICIPAIDIDSVLKVDKKTYPQAYLEQCKYKLKKRKRVNYIDLKIIDYHGDDSYSSDSKNENKNKIKNENEIKNKNEIENFSLFEYFYNILIIIKIC